MSGSSEKLFLTISAVTVNKDGSVGVDRSRTFTATLNPSEFSHTRKIKYNVEPTLGQIASETKFAAVEPDDVSLSLVLDGTGVVPGPPNQAPLDVEQQLKQLTDIVYTYDGPNHEPSHVRLLWGTLILFARMSSMSVQYTLFKPSGDPLRAKVTLAFVGFMSTKEAEAKAGRSSPDLTHDILVREGDTLPLLCHSIYGDAAYYPEVARVNGLDGFRKLESGTRLLFPRLY